MKQSRRVMGLGLVLSLVFGGSVSAQTVQTGQQVVVDGNNRLVGPLLGFLPPVPTQIEVAQVSFQIDGSPVSLNLAAEIPQRLLQSASEPYLVGFTTTDCTGTPFLTWVTGGVEPQTFGRYALVNETAPTAQLVAWRPVPGSPVSPGVVFQSGLLFEDGTCGAFNLTEDGIPAERFETGFVPPYAIVLDSPVLSPLAVPAVSPAGLTVLALGLAGAAFWTIGRRRREPAP